MNDLTKQLDFILEVDKLKAIYRRALIKADNNRFENSAEHSWHISIMAHILAPYAEGSVDIPRCQWTTILTHLRTLILTHPLHNY